VDEQQLYLLLKHLQGKLIINHCLAIFILSYCQLQLRLSLWLKGAPCDRTLSSDLKQTAALLRHGPKNGYN
jgi:hypothetical protein